MANVEKKLEQERAAFLQVEKEKEDKRIGDIVAMLKNKQEPPL